MISKSSNKIDEIVAPDEIETYVSMPSCLLQGCSNDLIIFRADGGNHFTHYGIYEGMFLIFDVSKDFKDGHLSCYLNNSGARYMWKSMLPIRRMERLDPEKSNLKMVRSTRSTV